MSKLLKIKEDELDFWIRKARKKDCELNELRDIAQRMFLALATKHTDSFVHGVLQDYQSYREVFGK